MKRLSILFVFAFAVVCVNAQLLYDILDGKYRSQLPEMPRSMNDGEHYTLKVNNTAIVKYNYKTGAFVDTVMSLYQLKNCPLKSFSGYEFSPNEAKMLIYNNVKYRYRRTFTADYYVVDLKRKEIVPLSEEGNQQEVPLFSPDSRYIAFARQNNLYMKKLDFNTEIAITKDGEVGKILNGLPDWVYEEEFEVTRLFNWSPDSKLLAFVKLDETAIPEFGFQMFSTPTETDRPVLYPGMMKFKYPKPGEANSKATVCVYDDFNKTTKFMKLTGVEGEFYVPRLLWSNNPEQLMVFALNRNQNRLDMLSANPKSTLSKLILRQEDKYYVDYSNLNYLQFTADNQFFFAVTENDGYRHIWQYRINGSPVKQITKGQWDVTDFYGYDETKKVVYYQSSETAPTQRDVYMVDAKGKKVRLSNGKGIHSANFSQNFKYFVHVSSSARVPHKVVLRDQAGKQLREMESNSSLVKKWDALKLPSKEFFTFQTSENIKLHGWMLKPVDFDANRQYPVLQVQYSGPDSQQALDSWSIGWEYYLASKGYLVVCVDGRGTGARGSEFRKCTYMQMGILEARDQVETAKYLAKQSFVDKNRIGIWGWSYGGSMTLWSMSTGEKIFKAGIAVAPVTDWRLYNTAYTERFMRRPQENFEGYEKTSAIEMASKLEGRLLLIHGTADDNVHYQNSLLYAEKLVEEGKQFEMQIYTDKNHSILGKQTRRHLYTRMSEFLFLNL